MHAVRKHVWKDEPQNQMFSYNSLTYPMLSPMARFSPGEPIPYAYLAAVLCPTSTQPGRSAIPSVWSSPVKTRADVVILAAIFLRSFIT